MARAIDVSGIQFRMLNRSRGPAVHGPRSQADRKLYKKAISNFLESHENLTILEGTVKDLTIVDDVIKNVVLDNDISIKTKSVVLTTGTFLGGVIHIGNDRIQAGRIGDEPSNHLSEKIRKLNLPIGSFSYTTLLICYSNYLCDFINHFQYLTYQLYLYIKFYHLCLLSKDILQN